MVRTAHVVVAAAAIAGCGYPQFEFGHAVDAETPDVADEGIPTTDTNTVDSAVADDGAPVDASACEAGLSSCEGRCVDVSTDFEHCSACNARCANGQQCASSHCASMPSCAAIH